MLIRLFYDADLIHSDTKPSHTICNPLTGVSPIQLGSHSIKILYNVYCLDYKNQGLKYGHNPGRDGHNYS